MLTGSIKQLVSAAVQSLKRSRTIASWRRALWPSLFLVELRCARRIEGLSRRLTGMQGKIAAMLVHVQSGRAGGAVDVDGSLRRMLSELKDDLNAIRRDLALWHARECRGRTGPVLSAAIARLNRIASDTFVAANKLEWEIAEHDLRYGR